MLKSGGTEKEGEAGAMLGMGTDTPSLVRWAQGSHFFWELPKTRRSSLLLARLPVPSKKQTGRAQEHWSR